MRLHPKNEDNKCWFHSTLHLLASIPNYFTSLPSDLNELELLLYESVRVILRNEIENEHVLRAFYEFIKNYNIHQEKEYDKTEIVTFLQYLISRSPHLKRLLEFEFPNLLECSRCKASRVVETDDKYYDCLHLHLPRYSSTSVSLIDLVDHETKYQLIDDEVFCEKCGQKTETWQKKSRRANPSLLLLVIGRIKITNTDCLKLKSPPKKKRKTTASFQIKNKKKKKQNLILLRNKINFPITNIKFEQFSKIYDVLATIHGGSPGKNGHFWCISRGPKGWIDNDDLKDVAIETEAPGTEDSTVCLILLGARGNS